MANLLTCPKCQGEMRNYERNGIHIDQCGECRGVFLDRGELEHLMAAEAAFAQPAPAAVPPPAPARQEYREQEYRSKDHGYDHGYDRSSSQKRKKSSFLSELFD